MSILTPSLLHAYCRLSIVGFLLILVTTIAPLLIINCFCLFFLVSQHQDVFLVLRVPVCTSNSRHMGVFTVVFGLFFLVFGTTKHARVMPFKASNELYSV